MEIIVVIICWMFILSGFAVWQLRLHRATRMEHDREMEKLSQERQGLDHRHWKETHQLTAPMSPEQLEAARMNAEANAKNAEAARIKAETDWDRQRRSRY